MPTTSNNGLSSTDAVRRVFETAAELTDAALVSQLPEFHRGQVIPARGRLEHRGEVELVRTDESRHKVWRRTPPERREEAKRAAQERRKSPAEKLARLSAERRAQVAAALLEDDEVNKLLREQTERARAMRRARARAQEAQAETEAERRERKRKLHEAERERSRYLDFLKVHDVLRDSVGALFGVRTHMREDLRRRDQGEEVKVPPERWPAVGTNLREVIYVAGDIWHDLAAALDEAPEHCPLCGERTVRDPHALDEGYIDADAEEVVADKLTDDREGA